MIDFNTILSSPAVQLRPIEKEDLVDMQELTGNPAMWTYFTNDLSVAEELKKWIVSAIQDRQAKKRLGFSIIDLKTKKIIGSTSLGNLSVRDSRIEIGWTWIAEKYQGKGYNAQVKSLLLKYCFEACGFERVELKTDVLNIPARSALEKMRFTQEGILRSHTQMIRNRRRDTIFYSVLKNEWPEMKMKNNWP